MLHYDIVELAENFSYYKCYILCSVCETPITFVHSETGPLDACSKQFMYHKASRLCPTATVRPEFPQWVILLGIHCIGPVHFRGRTEHESRTDTF